MHSEAVQSCKCPPCARLPHWLACAGVPALAGSAPCEEHVCGLDVHCSTARGQQASPGQLRGPRDSRYVQRRSTKRRGSRRSPKPGSLTMYDAAGVQVDQAARYVQGNLHPRCYQHAETAGWRAALLRMVLGPALQPVSNSPVLRRAALRCRTFLPRRYHVTRLARRLWDRLPPCSSRSRGAAAGLEQR